MSSVPKYMTIMSIIITEEDLCKNSEKSVHIQFYPKNVANPGMMGTKKRTLNIILVLIIITHAWGFKPIRIFWGEVD